MQVVSVDDVNAAWMCERIIVLLDEVRCDDAAAVAQEWGYDVAGELNERDC